jgi:hypothetical protein
MATTGRATTPRGREMRELLRRWVHSGRPLEEFARENRLSPKTLAWWRWKLGREERRSREIELVEVTPAAASAAACFEVVLRNGTVVRVPATFEEAVLERLVRTLGRC